MVLRKNKQLDSHLASGVSKGSVRELLLLPAYEIMAIISFV